MVSFPNAKINLGLHVRDKKSNGFHDLETVFCPVELSDILEIIPSTEAGFSFNSSGLPIPGDPDQNLCIRAYNLLKADHEIPPVAIHLHKVIPMGAGLGGGSSDGAFTLKMLNEMFGLQITEERLHEYALKLGSDCPFFLVNRPLFAHGRGDEFENVNLDLTAYKILIVVPPIHINTARAYAMIDEQRAALPFPDIFKDIHKACHLINIVESGPGTWSSLVENDFETPVFSEHPVLPSIKQKLYEKGAIYASMSGSGSAMYGVFAGEDINTDDFGVDFTWTGRVLR